VLADRARSLVRAEARVEVGRVVREVLRDPIGVAAAERVVVGADVVEPDADVLILPSDRGRGYTASR